MYTSTLICTQYVIHVCLFINIKIIVTAPTKHNMANVERQISRRWRGEIC